MMPRLPDLDLIGTEAVTVLRPGAAFDDLGEPVPGESERTEVPGCIVQPGATSDLDATRPNGVRVAFTVYMRAPGFSLRGCSIKVRGKPFRVIGDPRSWTAANVPGGRNLTVEVEATDG